MLLQEGTVNLHPLSENVTRRMMRGSSCRSPLSSVVRILMEMLSNEIRIWKSCFLALTCCDFADYKAELAALNKELIVQYVHFASTLVDRPSSYGRDVEAISVILRNMHFLLNCLRSHQVSCWSICFSSDSQISICIFHPPPSWYV